MNATRQITVLLIEDHKLVRIGLRTVLEDTARIRIVGEAATVSDGVAAALRFRPNVAVIDIRLPDGTGFEVCRKIKAALPESKALLLTSYIDDPLVLEAIAAGADGYLLKSEEQDIAEAIETVAAGGAVLDPAVTRRMLNQASNNNNSPAPSTLLPFGLLSKQELRVIELVAGGGTNREIAAALKLGEKTVRNYLSNVFTKLNITRRSEAAAWFVRQTKR